MKITLVNDDWDSEIEAFSDFVIRVFNEYKSQLNGVMLEEWNEI